MSAPLVMIPGIGGDATAWKGMPAGEVMLPDGDSIDAMAADILARAPGRFALAGHSMGGYVALAIVAAAPDRVARLALLATSAAPDTPEQRANRMATMEAARADYPAVVEALLRAMLQRDARADANLVAEKRAMLLGAGVERFLRQQAATLARPDRRPMLPEIAVATLVLHGEDDRVVAPERSREMAAAIPGARLAMLPRCGHSPQRERAKETKAAMTAWLEDEA
jgi:pimeloyl-ACP methyl ester carboxylesterase